MEEKTKDKLDIIFDSISQEVLSLESERLAHKSQYLNTWVFGICITVMALFLSFVITNPSSKAQAVMPFFILLAGLGLTFEYSRSVKKSFKLSFKNKIISKLIYAYNPALGYFPEKRISDATFAISKLFKKTPHDIKGEDFIEGKYGDTDFRLSELHATYESSDGDGDSSTHDIFKGLFLVADFHKYFHSETFILPETGWKALGLNKKKFQGAALIEMEDQEFEDQFRVFTTNDQDARYILSPSMLQRIKDLRKRFGDDLWISFRGESMYVALKTQYNFFEHDIKLPIEKNSLVEEHIKDLKSILGIMDDLNLNTRIWSKIPQRLLADEEEDKLIEK